MPLLIPGPQHASPVVPNSNGNEDSGNEELGTCIKCRAGVGFLHSVCARNHHLYLKSAPLTPGSEGNEWGQSQAVSLETLLTR